MQPWSLPEWLGAGPGDDPVDRYFAHVAEALLSHASLELAGQPHRVRELEFYLHSEHHPDPYVHRSPLQQTSARWYFHREGSGYRGGSFKGLDLTFGPATDHGGILLRSLSCPDGTIINGSSLCVDYLLQRTGATSVAALDAALGERSVFEPGPLYLRADRTVAPSPWATARVGLTFQRLAQFPDMPSYFARKYRFLDAPRAIKKGKAQLVIAMHEAGLTVQEIAALTGTPRATITTWRAAYDQARDNGAWQHVAEGPLGSQALCAALGALAPRDAPAKPPSAR